MKSLKTNEFLRATAAPYISTGWITPDLKELGYVATMMIPVVKLGLISRSSPDERLEVQSRTHTERQNVFHLQVHLTQEQVDTLSASLKAIASQL